MVDPYIEDAERISEAVWRDSEGNIVDRDTFDLALKRYIKGAFSSSQRRMLFPKVFDFVRKAHPEVSPRREFKEAGGDSLSRDQLKRARRIAKTKAEYRRLGADRADYEGLDTPPKHDYSTVGKIGKKVVHAYRDKVNIRGKEILKYRDKRGRFVKVKK